VESEENSTHKTLRVFHYFPQPLLLAHAEEEQSKNLLTKTRVSLDIDIAVRRLVAAFEQKKQLNERNW